jgi:proteasome lid subunit RPN8/RPN11
MRHYPPLTWRSTCGQYTVRVTKRAYWSVVKLATQHSPNEVGTSLVGSYSDDGYRAIVHSIAPLSSDSQGSPTAFFRGVRGLREFFGTLVARFRGHRHYIGEWHSHPGGSPASSSTDDHNQAAIASDKATDCPESILLIIGGTFPTHPNLRLYIFSRTRGKLELQPVQ